MKSLEDYARRFLTPARRWVSHPYLRNRRNMTLGVRGMILDGEGCVFLVRHSYQHGWYMPGGGVEHGETILAALERELREEGNIELSEPPILHAVYYNNRISRRDHVALYIVRQFRQIRPPEPNYEIIAHGFFATDDLPTDTTPGTRARIAEVLTGRQPAMFW
jgi:8-oxo-dGTP pyrophosphatase MutT (NUDIX family)